MQPEKNKGLIEPPTTESRTGVCKNYKILQGDVRKAIKDFVSPGKEYTLFKTIASDDAFDKLKEYIGFRDEEGSEWEIRKIEEGDDPTYVPGACDNGNGLAFNNNLMGMYEEVIDELAEDEIGDESYVRYPSVFRTHHLSKDPKAIFQPKNYIVESDKEEGLKGIIQSLSGDKAFEKAEEIQSPWCRHMGEVKILNKLGIDPIDIMDERLELEGEELSKYADFLTQPMEIHDDPPIEY